MPQQFQRYLVTEATPLTTGCTQASITERTAATGMIRVGYKYGLWQKNVYVDGHERADVVAYRANFMHTVASYIDRMRFYGSEDMGEQATYSSDDEPEVVWVTHDESGFYANDDGDRRWSDKELLDLPKKGHGRSIMVVPRSPLQA